MITFGLTQILETESFSSPNASGEGAWIGLITSDGSSGITPVGTGQPRNYSF